MSSSTLKKDNRGSLEVVAHAFKPSTQAVEAGGFLSSRLACATEKPCLDKD